MHTEAMPQAQLPIFPFSSTAITGELAFENRDGMVYYFNGHLPVVCHGAEDLASFRLYTSQFIANGNASQKEIQARGKERNDLIAQRKEAPKHVMLKNLPLEQRVSQLHSARKHFVDTIKLLAYRAETTLVGLIKETLGREDESRSFVRAILKTSVNLRPNPAEGILEIQLHGQANPMHDECAAKLCRELNETETKYPGTDLRIQYTTLRPEKKNTSVS